MGLVTIEVGSKKGRLDQKPVLLTPKHCPPRTGGYFQVVCPKSTKAVRIMEAAFTSEFVAIDFETTGLDYLAPDFQVVGMSLAHATGSLYLDWKTQVQQCPPVKGLLRRILKEHPGLVAHNVQYDGGIIRNLIGLHPKWAACTLAVYKSIANEGYVGFSHGLKAAQTLLLKWTESNEKDLSNWLIQNGYVLKTKKNAADMSQMWRAPASVLGKYGVLDAEATYLLWTEQLKPVIDEFGTGMIPWLNDLMTLIELHIDQYQGGMLVDRDLLKNREASLDEEIERKTNSLRDDPVIGPKILEIEAELRAEGAPPEPKKFKKVPPLPKEPQPGTKKHDRWAAAVEKRKQEPGITKSWMAWKAKMELISAGAVKDFQFNIRSGQQLVSLLYDKLKAPQKLFSDKTGAPSTSAQALAQMGPLAGPFIDIRFAEKELGFITKYLELTETRPSIHPWYNIPGTKTGRLSCVKPNLQQMPKSKAVMEIFHARPGHVLVDADFAALESVVAAELSGDPNLFTLYGDGQPENDIHLFLAAATPGLKEKVLATGYTPVNPPPGTVSKAKKEAKSERSKAKTVVYACQFGAGVQTIMESLEKDGIILPEAEVALIHRTYWNLFSVLKKYSYRLQDEWRINGGYVLNGFGRPMCIPEDDKHNALSRVIQSTGHDILMRYVTLLAECLDEAGVRWRPWVIDWHDAATIEVPEEQLELAVSCYKTALARLNNVLQCTIKLKATPSWGRTMADIKEPTE